MPLIDNVTTQLKRSNNQGARQFLSVFGFWKEHHQGYDKDKWRISVLLMLLDVVLWRWIKQIRIIGHKSDKNNANTINLRNSKIGIYFFHVGPSWSQKWKIIRLSMLVQEHYLFLQTYCKQWEEIFLCSINWRPSSWTHNRRTSRRASTPMRFCISWRKRKGCWCWEESFCVKTIHKKRNLEFWGDSCHLNPRDNTYF